MQAFQIWYLASYPEIIGHETEMVSKSQSAFPHLEALSREARLVRGAEFIAKLKASRCTDNHAERKEKGSRNH